MLAYSRLTIKTLSILENLQSYPNVSIMPMVKGNGYGIGMIPLAQWLDPLHLPYLGVSHVLEGVQLREAGIKTPIFVLNFLPEQAPLLASYTLTPTVDSLEKIKALSLHVQPPFPVHLKLNLGMNRFGVNPFEWPLLYHAIMESKKLHLEGILSHFSSADDPAFDAQTREQRDRFQEALDKLPTLPKWIHLGASAGQRRFPLSSCNLARIGLGLFLPNQALTLEGRIVGLRDVAAGQSIGYNSRPVDKPMRIATIGMGYHDGWHASYGFGKSSVIYQGRKLPVIGQICMDFLFIDVTQCPDVHLGDFVEFFGPQAPLEQVAADLGVNPRYLLSGLGPRIERIWNYESLQKADCAHAAIKTHR